ncbi:SIMPL domain-containing protein [uncultured Albimonas sp.]|uniref:SIMPL domain-containing protein n=1 Tax=uncultured Albimonas sp. TaxID=1331701 RepID=UPI0030ECB84F
MTPRSQSSQDPSSPRRAARRGRLPSPPSTLSMIALGALLVSSVALSVPAFAAQPLAEPSGKAEKREMRRELREEWLEDADAAADRLQTAIKAAGREGETLDARISKAMEADQALQTQLRLAQAASGGSQPARPAPERPAREARAEAPEQCRGRLVVEGEGIETATPDVLRVSFGADARAEGPGEALSRASQATKSLLDAVLAAGVAREDVSTTQVSLNPVYERSDRADRNAPPEIVAWEAGSSLAVTLKDVSGFGALATAATEAGATRISGVSFAVSDEKDRLEAARMAAVKAALARADLLAQAAGARVGAILELSESGISIPGPRPMFARAAVSEASMSDMPLAEGAQELRASVNLTVELCQ